MKMYAKKFWGFVSPEWQLITFSSEGIRSRLQGLCQSGGLMLMIGTQGEPTPLELRGRIIGYCEVIASPVKTCDIVPADILAIHGDKWPFGLLSTQSWKFNEPPLFKDFLPEFNARYPGMALASSFAELPSEDVERIKALPVTHTIFPKNDVSQRAIDATDIIRHIRGRGRGPVAYTGDYSVTRSSKPAKTYLMKLNGHNIMKVGWAYNPKVRAETLSQSVVPPFTGLEWKVLQVQSWDNEYQAYFMEQQVIDLIDENNFERSKEYFKVSSKADIENVTISMWTKSMSLAIKNTTLLSDDELKICIRDIISVVSDLE